MFFYKSCKIVGFPEGGRWSNYYTLEVYFNEVKDQKEPQRILMPAEEFEAMQILDKMVRNGSMTEVTARACWTHLWEAGREFGYENGYRDATETEDI